MGISYLLDTNTVIDFVNKVLSANAAGIIAYDPKISFITRIELLAWPQLSINDENIYKTFISRSTVYGCNEAIILQTIATRKQYKLKLPDAMIAATALIYNLTLLSRNLKDFKGVNGLTVIDPHTL